MLKTSLLSSAAVLAFSTTMGIAQETFALDEIIVSGGLSPIAAQEYGRSVSVVTAQEIQDRGISTVVDALRALPGVSVSSAGSGFVQVRMRGGEARHTLVLLDGVQLAGGEGEYTFSGLQTTNIERIEVLRGPQSVVYGSNATTGVINIITRKGTVGKTYDGTFEVGGATAGSVFLSRRDERGGISLSLSRRSDPSFDQSGDGGERDKLDRLTAVLSGDYLVTDTLKLGFVLRRSKEYFDFDATNFAATDADSYIVDDTTLMGHSKEVIGSVFAEYAMLEGRLVHRLAYERTENKARRDGAPQTQTDADVVKYRLSYGLDGNTVAEADHLLNVMLETHADSSPMTPLYERSSKSVAVEYRARLSGGLDFQAGVRHDDNDLFEDATTWNVALSYLVPNTDIRLHSSMGTGVLNPSYFSLYANAFGYTGNPDLDPERNKSFDIGAEFPVLQGRGTVDVTYFDETLTDEISPVSLGGGAFTYGNQTGDSTRKGVEIAGNLQATDAVALRMSYTYLNAKNPDGSVEIRRPRHELSLGATVETFGGRGQVAVDLRHVSGNYDTQFFGTYETAELPAYTTVDVATEYEVNDTYTLTARVTNLFKDEAVDVWGYGSPDRAAYVGFRANF
ncbi:TonB-dependent receptor plug domain-containing protein [Roseobacter sp. GAI101]|uniref:TonB-dependent receptor plug domain-containing protein n=1 Tax=Roseobacter sp. (strain GAI101) TaxID=391589 RepID=UPI0020C77971|nr:TonB-dependent receptor [Roseobacter sp. GAI101]